MSSNPVVSTGHVRVKVVTSQEIVAAGIRALLSGYGVTVEVDDATPTVTHPDVVLYDVLGLHEGDGADLVHWVQSTSALVIAVSRELRPDLGASAVKLGVDAVVPLGVPGDQLAGLIKAAVAGDLKHNREARRAVAATRLGHEAGLTLREAETLALIVRGKRNVEVAQAYGLSINSVKSYIRSAYRKMGVSSRTQAVAWGVQHGFALDAPVSDSSRQRGLSVSA